MEKPRKVADCRLMPSDKHCTVAIAGSEEEVLPLAVYHAIHHHGHEDTPDLGIQIRSMLVDDAESRLLAQ